MPKGIFKRKEWVKKKLRKRMLKVNSLRKGLTKETDLSIAKMAKSLQGHSITDVTRTKLRRAHFKGTEEQYEKRLALKQERLNSRLKPDSCEICGMPEKDLKKGLCFDHDHKTGKFRGWICTRCNAALGMVVDNTETLIAMVEYLKKSRN